MFRLTLLALLALVSISAFAQERSVEGFNNRFNLVKNDEGKVTVIKLKRATRFFTIKPFIEQLKNDLLGQQSAMKNISEAELDQMLIDLGMNPYALHHEDGAEEARNFKESILNVSNIDVEAAFTDLDKADFWTEFQRRLNEAMLFLDPSVVANLEDSRFFYKKAVTHAVVVWALNEAKKHFSNIPILNIASFVIVRVHDMMLEQRHFAHNMMLHYFETVKEGKLGMTKLEVDRAVSSIYEYRIEATNIFESNRANANWASYGMNNFYNVIRAGNSTVNAWGDPLSARAFSGIKKLNFAFASVTHEGARKIYHLHHKAHMFSGKPSLAYDYSKPKRVKQLRSLLNIGGVALGFLKLPDFIKTNADKFMKSIYVQQVRTEGGLIGYFESTGDTAMMKTVFAQRSNLYIIE
ncbi:MAG: hypothetical protein H0V66_13210 [Bdellovibrionales bacterium]|nr:hypothetical protein [Bdellovibrionales bacterium]